ncbi:flagellar motor switch phosphatase FliY [Bacillus sp. RG28]|uniref:Flagellar motor switch phosphatase FliY n=1 Tax=Gottfriedia endophytica TaxID=2820819 RepID=A0A940SJN7_9BACI|nr:flagellar motor switch phosphatase FliY [Gottfriedia endophytica]MBP0726230.1 flagellar motor switch phosphatase FliY [Gottfriedia endophytica]
MMSDDILSQEEIELLLKGAASAEGNEEPVEEDDIPLLEEFLSSMETDTLGEIGNISIGSSATALSALLNQKVDITTPNITVIHRNTLEKEFQEPYVAVQVKYTIGFVGSNLFVINTRDAAIIANLMLGGDGTVDDVELDEIHLSAVQEAMNQMMGSAATSMSTIFKKKVDISPPSIGLLDFKIGEGTNKLPEDEYLIKVSFRIRVGDLIDSSIMQVLPINFGKELVSELFEVNEPKIEKEESAPAPQVSEMSQTSQPVPNNEVLREVVSTPSSNGNQTLGGTHQVINQTVQPAAFSQLQQMSIPENEARNLNMLYDIPLNVTVELGRTKRSVKEILELTTGSIIELDKLAGEPVDILVNNKLIAKGEVVVIDENFGVRLTDIVSKTDRINNLK